MKTVSILVPSLVADLKWGSFHKLHEMRAITSARK